MHHCSRVCFYILNHTAPNLPKISPKAIFFRIHPETTDLLEVLQQLKRKPSEIFQTIPA